MSAAAIKVFALDDCDWWAGESLEACIAAARQQCGAEAYEDAETEGCLVGADAMQQLKFTPDEGGSWRTFAEQLAIEVADGGEFPRLFASTEW